MSNTHELHEIAQGRGIEVSDACPALFVALRAPMRPASTQMALLTHADDYRPLSAPRRAPVRPAGTVAPRVVTNEQMAGLL